MRLRIAVALYLVGLLLFYIKGTFLSGTEYTICDWLYFVWEQFCGGGALVWGVICSRCKREDRYIVTPVFWFSIIRLIQLVICWIIGVNKNGAIVVSAMFLILVIITSMICLSKESRIAKFLSKYAP